MFVSDFPAQYLANSIKDANVVDLLWLAESGNGGNVVDNFKPQTAQAAEIQIDASANTTVLRHTKSAKHTVCTTDVNCYAFYIDSDSDFAYQKSTDGGATWGGTGTQISINTTAQGAAVWYDRWTPGDTGDYVHTVYTETVTNGDRLHYIRFNTADDTWSTEVDASGAAEGVLAAGNDVAITKGTNGDIYVGTVDATAPTSGANFIEKCDSGDDCTTTGGWDAAGSNPWDGTGDDTDNNHSLVMLPMSGGDIMLVSTDIADGTTEYKIYDESANTWSSNFTNIDTITDSTTYTHALGGTVNLTTNDLYITMVQNAGTANTSEIRAWKYSGSWSQLTEPWSDTTDSTSVIVDADIGIDSTTGDLFVTYVRGDSLVTANDVYYAKSTDDGSSWTADNLLSDGTDGVHKGVSMNASSEDRLFAVWYDETPDDIFGGLIADPPAPSLSISQPDGVSDAVTVGDSYDITYTLADSDDTVTAAFYYDSNNSGLDGTVISGACASAAEGTDVTCSWDTTGVTPGSYYLYGLVSDGVNPQVSAYSSGQITISAGGSLSVDIVDSGGSSVASPSMAMDAGEVAFIVQTATGSFGTASQKLRVTNTTGTATWTLSVSATDGATAVWDSAGTDYDFNDPTAGAGDGGDADSVGGQMTINASVGTITPEGGCASTGLTKGSSSSFSQGSTDSITLLTAGGTAETGCYWDFTGISVSQTIPAEQPAASDYDINMTLSVVASQQSRIGRLVKMKLEL